MLQAMVLFGQVLCMERCLKEHFHFRSMAGMVYQVQYSGGTEISHLKCSHFGIPQPGGWLCRV